MKPTIREDLRQVACDLLAVAHREATCRRWASAQRVAALATDLLALACGALLYNDAEIAEIERHTCGVVTDAGSKVRLAMERARAGLLR